MMSLALVNPAVTRRLSSGSCSQDHVNHDRSIRPFMIGICQGQMELSPRSSRRRGFVSSRFLTGRALYASDPERFCIRAVRFFRPEFLRLVKINGQSVTSYSFARIQPSEKAFTED
jgi:hypothetical protein